MARDDYSLEQDLKRSKDEWQWKVYQMLRDGVVSPGHLITYGRLAELTNEKYGTRINARNAATLRRKLYGIRRDGTHEVPVPLHRIAKQGDVEAAYDSEQTRPEVRRLREQEGAHQSLRWV